MKKLFIAEYMQLNLKYSYVNQLSHGKNKIIHLIAFIRYVEHGVSVLNQYANYCPYDCRKSEFENIFY